LESKKLLNYKNGLFDKIINLRKKYFKMSAQKDLKNVPCSYFNSNEGCTKTAEACVYSHKSECNHIGCKKKGVQHTHLADNCGFIKMQKNKSVEESQTLPKEVPLTKDDVLNKIYEKLIKKLAGRFVGMFGEAYELSDLQKILDDEKDFDDNVKLACKTLADN